MTEKLHLLMSKKFWVLVIAGLLLGFGAIRWDLANSLLSEAVEQAMEEPEGETGKTSSDATG